jgi:hypothetical protein
MKLNYQKIMMRTRDFTIKESGCLSIIYRWKMHRMGLNSKNYKHYQWDPCMVVYTNQVCMENSIAGFELMP